jgi:hypothetical protein
MFLIIQCAFYSQAIMEEKLAEIEKNKNDAISKVKQAANKLKFTLKGSVARDQDHLQMSLASARDRLVQVEQMVTEATAILQKSPARPDVGVSVSLSGFTFHLYSFASLFQTLKEARE